MTTETIDKLATMLGFRIVARDAALPLPRENDDR
jgi:hypothetical protein